MELIKYFKMGMRKYSDFSTRSSRKEFGWFQLGYFLFLLFFAFGIGFIGFILADLAAIVSSVVSIFSVLFLLAIFILILIPQIAITVRRIHDAGHSGWSYLLTMIPYIGIIPWLIFGIMESEPRANKWGPIPGQNGENILKDTLIDFDNNRI